jgi:hypothetical protein
MAYSHGATPMPQLRHDINEINELAARDSYRYNVTLNSTPKKDNY